MHTSYHAKIQFLHNHIVEIPRSIFFLIRLKILVFVLCHKYSWISWVDQAVA